MVRFTVSVGEEVVEYLHERADGNVHPEERHPNGLRQLLPSEPSAPGQVKDGGHSLLELSAN